jgi:hypothetical protein
VHVAFSASETSVVDAFHAAALENGGKDNCLEARRHDGRLGLRGGNTDWGQCSVPSRLTGVTAIAADAAHSLALARPMMPAPCKVPEVVAKRFASAKLTIAKRHCRTGKVRYGCATSTHARARRATSSPNASGLDGCGLPARRLISSSAAAASIEKLSLA